MQIPRIIQAFDLGSSTGWADIDGSGERMSSGHWSLGVKGKRWPRASWGTFHERVDECVSAAVFAADGPDRVIACYERVSWLQGADWARIYFGQAALLERVTHEHGVKCTSLLPQHWKLVSAGSGNASKPVYIEAANTRFGLDLEFGRPGDEDEAAALGVGYACYRELGGVQILAAGEQKEIA